MHPRFVCGAAFTLAFSTLTFAQAPRPDAALRTQVGTAMDKAIRFLDQQQRPEGFWTSGEYPGLTALIAQAYLATAKHKDTSAVKKALAFVRSQAKPDGSISAGRMANYNTSICLAALLRAGEARDEKLIEAARRFLIGAQVKGAADPSHEGGFGYDPAGGTKPARPDLDNTVFVLEALRLYRDSRKTREIPPGQDLHWQAAIDFITRCQQPASASASERGGLGYTPANGKEPLRAYGTMTYAGVLSFIYADLKKDDPRLLAARDWLARHYTLDENPGQGAQGLYYYYHLMAKGLTTLQIAELQTADGRRVNWRAELANKLLALQKTDGSWANENGRWMEKDPNLVTAYCLLALAHLHDQL
jgi:squalene-hopene/tetraprenyl-beta-curcumene cyclase